MPQAPATHPTTRLTPTTLKISRWPGSGAATTSVPTSTTSCGRPRSMPKASCSRWRASVAPSWPSTPRPARRSGPSASRPPSAGKTRCGRATARECPTPWSTARVESTWCRRDFSCTPWIPTPVFRSPTSATTARSICWPTSATTITRPTGCRRKLGTSPTRHPRSLPMAWLLSATATSRGIGRPGRRTSRGTSSAMTPPTATSYGSSTSFRSRKVSSGSTRGRTTPGRGPVTFRPGRRCRPTRSSGWSTSRPTRRPTTSGAGSTLVTTCSPPPSSR